MTSKTPTPTTSSTGRHHLGERPGSIPATRFVQLPSLRRPTRHTAAEIVRTVTR